MRYSPAEPQKTGMPADFRARLLKPEIIVPVAVFLASEEGRRITGRLLIATEWSPEKADDVLASMGIGA
jgi:NAD(P)-dependent dehydrogenase (short-subunit alcohol dehydrogenase family)